MSFEEDNNDKTSRRDFLRKAAAIGLGTALEWLPLSGDLARLQPRSPFPRDRCPADPSAGRA